MKHIFDPAFRYVPAVNTDLRKTFARVRAEQEAERIAREREVDERELDEQEQPA